MRPYCVSRVVKISLWIGEILFLCVFPLQVYALQLDGVAAPLKGIAVPDVPGLLDGSRPIVLNHARAIQLGKSLFWDMAVGSDGVACASCHFHAGADRRTRNQLDPGSRRQARVELKYQSTASGGVAGPNYLLKSRDFPFRQFADTSDKHSRLIFSSNDVVSSSGVFSAQFQDAGQDKAGIEKCQSHRDDLFHVGELNVRRVSTRNAPSVINAAFNYRNFWDGRANNLFNGVSSFGPRDPTAGIWVVEDGKVVRLPILLPNASLASQAVAPVLDDREMACAGRRFSDLGRKLLGRRPLAAQSIHNEDSVLAPLRHVSGKGLNVTYEELIRQSFASRFWEASGNFGRPGSKLAPWTQMEANFAFFFGIAIQLYETTLISDESPFDAPRGKDGFPMGFTEQQKRGQILFDKAECDFCHHGPTLTLASHPGIYNRHESTQTPKLVDRRTLNVDRVNHRVFLPMSDVGFANTSVTPTDYDPGLGGMDPFGHPLSFVEQYRETLLNPDKPMVDPIKITAADFSSNFKSSFQEHELRPPTMQIDPYSNERPESRIPSQSAALGEIQKPNQGRLAIAVRGAFKVPTLRNVELTGPYMHNGGMKSLQEVIEFYDRGGNLENSEHFGTFVFPQHFSQLDKQDLLAFLLTLTDERVRWERQPFDHPSLDVPQGGLAEPNVWPPVVKGEQILHVPEVGKNGRTRRQGPLKPFAHYLR